MVEAVGICTWAAAPTGHFRCTKHSKDPDDPLAHVAKSCTVTTWYSQCNVNVSQCDLFQLVASQISTSQCSQLATPVDGMLRPPLSPWTSNLYSKLKACSCFRLVMQYVTCVYFYREGFILECTSALGADTISHFPQASRAKLFCTRVWLHSWLIVATTKVYNVHLQRQKRPFLRWNRAT